MEPMSADSGENEWQDGRESKPGSGRAYGFVTPPQLTETVKADGSLVINYYYARNKYTQTLSPKKRRRRDGDRSDRRRKLPVWNHDADTGSLQTGI